MTESETLIIGPRLVQSALRDEFALEFLTADNDVATLHIEGQVLIFEGPRGEMRTTQYDAVYVRPDVLRITVGIGAAAVTVVVDLEAAHAIIVETEFTEGVSVQRFSAATLLAPSDGSDSEPPAPTNELTGRRAICAYGEDSVFEHIYLNTRTLAWQDLSGSDARAGVDPAAYWKLSEGLYVVGFQEPRYFTASTFVLDYESGISTGSFLSFEDGVAEHGLLGGTLSILSETVYPHDQSPA